MVKKLITESTVSVYQQKGLDVSSK